MREIPHRQFLAEVTPTTTIKQLEHISQTPLHQVPAEKKSEIVSETFFFFKDFLVANGFTEYTNLQNAYKTLPPKQFIARRENPLQIFPLLTQENGYSIDFQDNRYANCVVWNPATDGARGIFNAYMEGFTSLNGIVTVIVFEHRTDDDIIAMEDSIQNFYGLDRSHVRSFQGSVTADRVRCINIRVPGHLFPEEELTETEQDKLDEYYEAKESGKRIDPVMIHRSYISPRMHENEKDTLTK